MEFHIYIAKMESMSIENKFLHLIYLLVKFLRERLWFLDSFVFFDLFESFSNRKNREKHGRDCF